jgi:hypothetical protein
MLAVETLVQGWRPDPFGRHAERWMSAGTATDLVRDGTREGHDPPTTASAPPTKEQPHWIDVDRLPRGGRRPHPWLLRDLPPSYPGPPEPSRRRAAVGIGVACCSLFVSLAVVFGHVKPLYTPALPKDEVVGQVVATAPYYYFVDYSIPGHPDADGTAAAPEPAPGDGRVVVLYTNDPSLDFPGTVVSTSPPGLRLGVGF